MVELHDMPLTDAFISAEHMTTSPANEFIVDINIYECGKCFFVQNPADFDFDDYYDDYNYSSGHSVFVKDFMKAYARETLNLIHSTRIDDGDKLRVLEVGSGDGVQLDAFRELGAEVIGVEPSEFLASQAEKGGISTIKSMYNATLLENIKPSSIDCVLSSFTFDHMPNPIEYLETSHRLLKEGGILTFEVHNLEKITDRGEFCLFEHEHTIYLTPQDAANLVNATGFEMIQVDPLPSNQVRANSLIIYARKRPEDCELITLKTEKHEDPNFLRIPQKIETVSNRLSKWITEVSKDRQIVGYGVGGRGVMTLANIPNASVLTAMMDANYKSDELFTPKTHIPIISTKDISLVKNAVFLVFSFGYLDEITQFLCENGVSNDSIVSLETFFYE